MILLIFDTSTQSLSAVFDVFVPDGCMNSKCMSEVNPDLGRLYLYLYIYVFEKLHRCEIDEGKDRSSKEGPMKMLLYA